MSAKKAGEETKFRKKYKELKWRVRNLEEEHDRLTVELVKAKRTFVRLRTERSLLFDKLESVQQDDLGVLAVFGDFMLDDEIEDVITVERPKGEIAPQVLSQIPPQSPPRDGSAAPDQEGGSPGPWGGKRGKGRLDPNAPRRPANAFFHFSGEMRGQLREERGEQISRHDMTRLLGQKWKSMSEEEKKRYYNLYEKDKERYASELNAYQSGAAAGRDAQAFPLLSTHGETNGYHELAQDGCEGWMPTNSMHDAGVGAMRHPRPPELEAGDARSPLEVGMSSPGRSA